MKKKTTIMRKRHAIFFAIFRPIGRIYCRIRYGFTSKIYNLEKGKSHIVICNHTTFADQFMVGSYFNRNMYFIASDDLLNKWTGRYLIWMLGIIPKAKSTKDLGAVRMAKRVTNEGGNVMVFPEGNRTYSGELCHVDIAIAKFVKVLKSDLVIYNLVGGYGVLPRFANVQRKGKMQGLVREIIPASEVAEMTTEELHERIKAGLSVKEEKLEVKSKVIAENVERAVYICPNCGKMDCITSKGNMIGCKNCDLQVEYLEDLTLKTLCGNFNFNRISDWYKWQRSVAIETFSKEDNNITIGDDKINVFHVENMQLDDLGVFDVKFSEKEGLQTFKKGKLQLHVPFGDILNMGLMARTKVIIYTKNTIYQLKENGVPTSMMKYMNMFYIIKQRKEGITDDSNLFLGL